MDVERRLEELGLTLPAAAALPPGVEIPFTPVRVRSNRAFEWFRFLPPKDRAEGLEPSRRMATCKLVPMNVERRVDEFGLTLPAPTALPPGVDLPFAWVRIRGKAFVSGHGALAADDHPQDPSGRYLARSHFKFVVSHPEPAAYRGETRRVSGDIVTALEELKASPCGDLLLMCGPELLAELTRNKVVDEYMLYVCPNFLGRGRRLFDELDEPLHLRLLQTVRFSSGMTFTRYERVL